MKKIISFTAGLLIGVTLSAQNITTNERNEHGVRIIDADMDIVYEDEQSYGISLSYHEINGIENYYILLCIPEVSSSFEIKTDQQVLFKTSTGTKCLGLASTDTHISIGAAAGRILRSASVLYTITPDTALLLANEGVAKIRIYYTVNDYETYFDIETSQGNMSKYFKKAYKNIIKTIPLPVTKDKSEF